MYPHYKIPPLLRNLLRTETGVLGNLMQHVDFLQGLEQKLAAFLGPAVNIHCRIANYANDTLVLHADTPSWASRIRYNTPQILLYLQNECNLAALKTIRIKVMPASAQIVKTPDKQLKLGPHTANLIRDSALSVTDETLKSLLLKISKYTEDCS